MASHVFAVVPSLAPWHGDLRRDPAPYLVTTRGTWGDLNCANEAMTFLNRRGISCHLVVLRA